MKAGRRGIMPSPPVGERGEGAPCGRHPHPPLAVLGAPSSDGGGEMIAHSKMIAPFKSLGTG